MSERQTALTEAFQRILHEFADQDADRGIVTEWVAVVEVIGADGEPYLHMLHNDGSVQWRRLGLLNYAATVQQGIIINNESSDD